MAKRIKNLWPSRRRSAVQLAERLVTATAHSLPVDLKRIAAHRAVQRIEFAPLLTDGGLAVRSDGFVIYVRCDIGQDADLTARLAEDGTGSTLPETILRRARFTIAHEIAHTLFYDLRSRPPRPKTKVDDGASTTKLELACNQIAGLLVIPEGLMQRTFSGFEFVRPEEFRTLANTAMVSSEAVVHRFEHLRRFTHPEAILASIYRQNNDWMITAISRHYSLRNIFIAAKVGASIKELVDEPDFVLFGGEMREAHVEYIGHGGKRMKMRFACEVGIAMRRNRSLFVVGTPVPA
jgi:hypothetical protein